MKDSQKLRHKKKSIYIFKENGLYKFDDQYLTLAKNQEKVKRAIYKTIISSLFMIVVGIVLGVIVYYL